MADYVFLCEKVCLFDNHIPLNNYIKIWEIIKIFVY